MFSLKAPALSLLDACDLSPFVVPACGMMVTVFCFVLLIILIRISQPAASADQLGIKGIKGKVAGNGLAICASGRERALVQVHIYGHGAGQAKEFLYIILAPATPAIYSQALDEGLIKIFMDSGFCVLNPTCGACLGMSSGVLAEGEVCASTTNRNFNGRMGKGGMVHLMSPLSAAAAAITGEITDPRPYLA